MARPPLEVADVFRAHGAAWREANAGRVSLAQLKVMSAIETCRTAALGGHVERCEDCAHERISYNSCRNRQDGRHRVPVDAGPACMWFGVMIETASIPSGRLASAFAMLSYLS